MGLSPYEEDVFAEIVAVWRDPPGIPWSLVGGSVVVVELAVAAGVLLGFPLRLAVALSLSFLIALAVGLSLIGLSDRRARRA